jgi:MinD-like ATPase involved in chromosome partitioning or flagellar assembly
MSSEPHHHDPESRPRTRPRLLTVVDAPPESSAGSSPPTEATAEAPPAQGPALEATTTAAAGSPELDAAAARKEPEPARRPQPGRGALLAVCGLCGGAGASTLSLLIARYTVTERSGPVLVCDTGGPAGGLAAYAHAQAPRSLVEVAELVNSGLPADRPYATTRDGLRVLATGPRLAHECAADGVKTVLEHAQAAHALTVVDCGTQAREADQIALRQATHIAWVLPATRSGAARAERVLDAVNPYLLGRQLLVARRDHTDAKVPMRELKALAARCGGPLILIPHVPDLLDAKLAVALDAAQVGLQAILGALER